MTFNLSSGAVSVLDTAPAAPPDARIRHHIPVCFSCSVNSSGTITSSPMSKNCWQIENTLNDLPIHDWFKSVKWNHWYYVIINRYLFRVLILQRCSLPACHNLFKKCYDEILMVMRWQNIIDSRWVIPAESWLWGAYLYGLFDLMFAKVFLLYNYLKVIHADLVIVFGAAREVLKSCMFFYSYTDGLIVSTR